MRYATSRKKFLASIYVKIIFQAKEESEKKIRFAKEKKGQIKHAAQG